MQYEYKFIEIPLREKGLGTQQGDSFEKCKEIIIEQANNGWRLKQVVIPPNVKMGIAHPYNYQVIFEKSI